MSEKADNSITSWTSTSQNIQSEIVWCYYGETKYQLQWYTHKCFHNITYIAQYDTASLSV